MMSDCNEGDDINWDDLKTITSFDDIDDQQKNDENSIFIGNSTGITGNGIIDIVSTKATTPVSLLVESLVQQLCIMLEKDKHRSTQLYNSICEQLYQMNLIDETYAMGEFEAMRNVYQRALYQLVSVARGQNLPASLQNVWPISQPIGLDWSRYHRDFDELDFIAGGGFGKVYRARNKLDGTIYAVKKITIKSKTINQILIHLSEVKTLASLDHVNIVNYKAAWLEPLLSNGDGNNTSSLQQDDSDDSDSFNFSHDYHKNTFETTSKMEEGSTDFIEFLPQENIINDNNKTIDNKNYNKNNSDKCESKNKKKIVCPYENRSISIEKCQTHVKLKWATLYIQMTLCQETLREWIDKRNKHNNFNEFYVNYINEQKSLLKYNNICRSDTSNTNDETLIKTSLNDSYSDDLNENSYNYLSHFNVVTDIFLQLLSGLQYIHSRKIIHHDIKPSNIFVGIDYNGKLLIQLGDFGQACPLQNEHSGYGFGTPLYAAPEQLNGECNQKSDIYSLGIVLLELLITFSTDMERAATIKQIKSDKKMPTNIVPCFANLLKKLLNHHTKRPNVCQLIEIMKNMNTTKDNVILTLQRRLSEKDEEIQTLKSLTNNDNDKLEKKDRELKNKDREIKILKFKIKKMQSKTDEVKTKDEEIFNLKKLLEECRRKNIDKDCNS